jgi:hypothetical protein
VPSAAQKFGYDITATVWEQRRRLPWGRGSRRAYEYSCMPPGALHCRGSRKLYWLKEGV